MTDLDATVCPCGTMTTKEPICERQTPGCGMNKERRETIQRVKQQTGQLARIKNKTKIKI
jgi:hypothetical protein